MLLTHPNSRWCDQSRSYPHRRRSSAWRISSWASPAALSNTVGIHRCSPRLWSAFWLAVAPSRSILMRMERDGTSFYIYSIFSMIMPVTFSCFSTRARETDRHFPFQKLDSTEPSSCHNPNQKQRNSSCVQVKGRRWSLSSRWITIIVLYI